VTQDGERPGWLDREKKSFAELDRARRERRGGGAAAPPGVAAGERAKRAARQQLERADAVFGARREEARSLARELHEARGTPALAEVCRRFLDALGPPTEARDIACFLEAGVPALVLVGLEALRARHAAGALEATSGLRTQLRILAEDSDDDVAAGAEEVLDLF
jgi:hypothetical protein